MIYNPKKLDGYDKYEVQGWADTLKRAQEIQSDAKKLAAATNQLKREQEESKKTIAGLKVAEKNARKRLKKVFGDK
jgi:cell division protein FtsB